MPRITEKIPKNAVGVSIKMRIVDADGTYINLALITGISLSLKLKAPSGAIKTKTPVFLSDGSDGWIKYVTESGVLDEVSKWKVEATVSSPSYSVPTFIGYFYVTDTL